MAGLIFRNTIQIIQMVFKQMSYPYVMLYTGTDALFTLSVIIKSLTHINSTNADTCNTKYIIHQYHFKVYL